MLVALKTGAGRKTTVDEIKEIWQVPQLRETQILLSKEWNTDIVKQKPTSYGKIDYVDHTQVTQKLIALIPDVQITINYNVGNGGMLYDDAYTTDGETKKVLTGVALSVTGTVDGKYRVVEEIGMCDKPVDGINGKPPLTNGERAKECMSDAIKRCAMRLGVGIELYGKDANNWLSGYLQGTKNIEQAKAQSKKKAPTTK